MAIDAAFKISQDDPLTAELGAAMTRIGELTMENEPPGHEIERPSTDLRPLAGRGSKREELSLNRKTL